MRAKYLISLAALVFFRSFSAPAQDAVTPIVSAIQANQPERAVEQCQAALKSAPRDPRLWTLEGIAYGRLHQPWQALRAFQAALKLDAHWLAALEGAAQIEYQQNSDDAIPLLTRIVAIQPGDSTAHAMLAVLQYKKKDYAHAAENFGQCGVALSSQPVALAQYGVSLARLKRYDEAVPLLQHALSLQPDGPGTRYNLALVQWQAGHPQDAAETLRPLLENAKPGGDAVGLGVQVYESAGNTPAAVELLRRAIQANPRDPTNYLAFAMLSYDHGSFQAGVNMIDAGLTQIPNNAQLFLTRGILLSELAQFDKAMADFEHADQLDQHLALASTAEGLVHSQQHDLKGAVASFRAEVKQQPNDALTQYLLAEALMEQGPMVGSPGYEEELAAANRAVRLDPKLAQAHDLLATAYLRAGKTDLAIEHSRAALQSDQQDQSAVYHLILALRRTNHKDEIPSLMKRLAVLREEGQSQVAQKDGYRLSVPSAGEAQPSD